MTISMQVRLLVLACSPITGWVAFGQTFGSIDGETRDSSGAVVTAVTGSATNNGTNAVRTAVANDAGVGDAGRNTIIGPAGFYWDFSTHKSFRMPKEGHVLQFRWEAFNSGLQRGEKCA